MTLVSACGKEPDQCKETQRNGPASAAAVKTVCVLAAERYLVNWADPSDMPLDVTKGIPTDIAAKVLAATGRTVYAPTGFMDFTGLIHRTDDLSDAPCDSFLKIDVRGSPLAGLYGPNQGLRYTGAEVTGELQLLQNNKVLAERQFSGTIELASSVSAEIGLGSRNPAWAPFESSLSSPGGFAGALFALVGDAFGYEFLLKIREFWIEGYRLRPSLVFPPQFLDNHELAAGLGDIRDKSAAKALLSFLYEEAPDDPTFVVEAAAAQALGQSGSVCAVPNLIERLEVSEHTWLWFGTRNRYEARAAAIKALGSLRPPPLHWKNCKRCHSRKAWINVCGRRPWRN